jgi:enoyl-CoA hydratase
LTIELEHRANVAVLTMSHGKANALDVELCNDLIARFHERAASQAAAVVITGRGSIFSAGVDLLRVVDGGASYLSRFLPALSDAFEAMFAFPKPVVAAVNGHAVAGGCILVSAADRRLMARGAGRIGLPELIVGVPFPPVPLEIMRFATAPHRLSELMFGGKTLTADDAVAYGLADTAVEPERLLPDAIAVAASLASQPAAAFSITKRQLREPALARMRSARKELDSSVEALWADHSTIAAIQTYIERTFKKSGSS